MNLLKYQRDKRHHSKKENKLIKLIKPTSESEDEESEHELSYYLNDRVKLMKEILKIIKPKKIRVMAPDCMKNMDNEEINSMLLEELLGISNKRLRYIFSGQSLNEESSSTDPEDQVVDIISLDDISDDDLIIDLDSDHETKKKRKKHKTKIKQEPKRKKVKKEKHEKEHDTNKKVQVENPMSEKNLMSVLELLELQARARAIKSQLALETKISVTEKEKTPVEESDNDEDAVILECPENVEIIITSSESEDESNAGNSFWKNAPSDESRRAKNNVDKKQNEQATTAEASTNVKTVKIINQTTIRQAQHSSPTEEKDAHNANTKTNSSNHVDLHSKGTEENQEKSTISDIPLPLKDKTSSSNSENIPIQTPNENTESQMSNDSEETKTGIELPIDSNQNEQQSKYTKKETQTEEHSTMESKDKEDLDQTDKPVNEKTSNKNENQTISAGEIDETDKVDVENSNIACTDFSEEVRTSEENKNKAERKILNKLRSIRSEKELLSTATKSINKNEINKRNNSSDESEEIVINLEQTEMDCINLD